MRNTACFLFAACLLASSSQSAIFPPGAKSFAPVATSAAAPNRQALLIVPAFAGGGESARGALAQSDAAAYRDLLRLLGFSVTVIAADTRPGLDLAIRGFASRMPRDADTVVFVLGTVIQVDEKLYVPGSDLSAADRSRDRIVTQGLEISEILRRIVDRGPRELVAIIDECGGGEPNPACAIGRGTIPDNVSAIVVHRVARNENHSGPVAGVASVRQDLLALMKEPDLSFLKLYARLKDRLEGTNDALVSTQALSRSFVFLPLDFFEKLPSECNRIEAGIGAEALKAMPSVTSAVPACEAAAETWSFSPFFKDKLEVAREQLAFQTAMADCDRAKSNAYLDRYSSGSYRFAVTNHKAECDRPPPSPEPPPAPVRVPPPGPSLTDRAYSAVTTYYEHHGYHGGLDRQALSELYPAQFDRDGTFVSREKHLRDLASFYTAYDDFEPRIIPGTLDYSRCTEESSCLVHGAIRTTKRKVGESDAASSRANFAIRFDLRSAAKVTYECSRVQGRQARQAPCD